MQTFPRLKRRSFVRRHAVLCVSLAALFAGGVGFAATGGTQVVKHWIVKLELISTHGQVLEAHLQPVDGGNATTLSVGGGTGTTTFQLQADAIDVVDAEGGLANVAVELRATTDPGSNEAGLSFTAEATANVEHAPPGVAERVEPVMAEIGEAVGIVDWIDEAGEWQELHVVPVHGDTQGFDVFTTFYGEFDETLYRQLGSVRGLDPETTEVGELIWPDAGLAIIPFLRADGSDLSLAVELTGRRAESEAGVLEFESGDDRNVTFKLNRIDVEKAGEPSHTPPRDRR